MVIVPWTEPVAGNPLADFTDTPSVVVPVPDAGRTESHGWLDVAVHEAGAAPPAWTRRTVCWPVTVVNAAPELVAPKISALRSIVTTAEPADCVTTNSTPPIVIVPLRAAPVEFDVTVYVTDPSA